MASDQNGRVSLVERTALYVFSKTGSKVSMNVLENSTGYPSGPAALLFFECLIASLISSCEIVLSSEALCWSDKRLNKVVSERRVYVLHAWVPRGVQSFIVILKDSQDFRSVPSKFAS